MLDLPSKEVWIPHYTISFAGDDDGNGSKTYNVVSRALCRGCSESFRIKATVKNLSEERYQRWKQKEKENSGKAVYDISPELDSFHLLCPDCQSDAASKFVAENKKITG